jgi:hypothetical protein
MLLYVWRTVIELRAIARLLREFSQLPITRASVRRPRALTLGVPSASSCSQCATGRPSECRVRPFPRRGGSAQPPTHPRSEPHIAESASKVRRPREPQCWCVWWCWPREQASVLHPLAHKGGVCAKRRIFLSLCVCVSQSLDGGACALCVDAPLIFSRLFLLAQRVGRGARWAFFLFSPPLHLGPPILKTAILGRRAGVTSLSAVRQSQCAGCCHFLLEGRLLPSTNARSARSRCK